MESDWYLQDVACGCGPSVVSASHYVHLCGGCGGALLPQRRGYMAVLRSEPYRGPVILTLAHSRRTIEAVPAKA